MRKTFDNTAHIRLRYPHFQQKVGISLLKLSSAVKKMIDAQASFFITENQQNHTFKRLYQFGIPFQKLSMMS